MFVHWVIILTNGLIESLYNTFLFSISLLSLLATLLLFLSYLSLSLFLSSLLIDSAVKDVQKISLLHNGVIHPSYAPTATPVSSFLIVSYTVSMLTVMSADEVTSQINYVTSSGALLADITVSMDTVYDTIKNEETGVAVGA